MQLLLDGVSNQSYLCVVPLKQEKDMLNQDNMTELARAVFNELSDEPATVGDISQNTHLTRERCQLILTQLVMAGLSDYQFGCYKRLP
ncbi:TrmB family transcriptional regulator [Raoultella ornithinolytica]|uniref:TrmB family transcriptional regulator n=1 Tax=Klebsiella/Raoultella group TaxID=2890311 RepID=UPI001D19460B|nr:MULTISPECIES: TrmB family transcriptional regulator [Klebsiella/Raoultella group]MDI0348262.1 TrmB family transcriptional regulator [Raoultella ornithinolytica]MDI0400296.1 TrmB family transcriptional regulator [Raoultella ornithinolytica]MDI0427332.1 TrmB family transcriptional regulator [Raoultella ornithinolytica]MDI0446301.1 TrmB family transcriptional regulator [Raoultella ornithinolytica]MDI0451924.1 TrmB family transcriptional regulator [Raoultella ornithinolytica]